MLLLSLATWMALISTSRPCASVAPLLPKILVIGLSAGAWSVMLPLSEIFNTELSLTVGVSSPEAKTAINITKNIMQENAPTAIIPTKVASTLSQNCFIL